MGVPSLRAPLAFRAESLGVDLVALAIADGRRRQDDPDHCTEVRAAKTEASPPSAGPSSVEESRRLTADIVSLSLPKLTVKSAEGGITVTGSGAVDLGAPTVALPARGRASASVDGGGERAADIR